MIHICRMVFMLILNSIKHKDSSYMELIRIQKQDQSLVQYIFPEYNLVYGKPDAKRRNANKATPLPEDILTLGIDGGTKSGVMRG